MLRVLLKIVPKPETYPPTCNDLICYNEGIAHPWRNERLLNKLYWHNWQAIWNKGQFIPSSIGNICHFCQFNNFECPCYVWRISHIINSVTLKSKFGIVSQPPLKVDKNIWPRLQKLYLLAHDSGYKLVSKEMVMLRLHLSAGMVSGTSDFSLFVTITPGWYIILPHATKRNWRWIEELHFKI